MQRAAAAAPGLVIRLACVAVLTVALVVSWAAAVAAVAVVVAMAAWHSGNVVRARSGASAVTAATSVRQVTSRTRAEG